MPKVNRPPTLTNRGPAGLLRKLAPTDIPANKGVGGTLVNEVDYSRVKIDNISPPIAHMAVAIDTLSFDPMNARLHPDKNREAIKLSLAAYGQLKPIVVRREGMVVIAGNGTLLAAKELGWTKLAASITDISAVDAAGYGLADNRTAELAKWDFEVVARLEKLIREQDGIMVGWSSDELEVLRAAEWVPPSVEDGDAHPTGEETRLLKLTKEQAVTLDKAVAAFKKRETQTDKAIKDWTDEQCLVRILQDWLGEEPYIETSSEEEE